jgi:hypothetical protein
MSQVQTESPRAQAIIDYEKQSEKLSPDTESTTSSGTVVEEKFITSLDPVRPSDPNSRWRTRSSGLRCDLLCAESGAGY